jgi:hypothetical protein
MDLTLQVQGIADVYVIAGLLEYILLFPHVLSMNFS